MGTFLDDSSENIRESSVGQIILLAGSGNGVSIRESPLFFIDHTVVHTNTFYLPEGQIRMLIEEADRWAGGGKLSSSNKGRNAGKGGQRYINRN